MHLPDVAAVRRAALGRPGWWALFTRAYAAVAARRPRCTALTSLIRAAPYEHPINIAAVAVARPVGDEEAVFFVHLRLPEEQSLCDLDRYLRQGASGRWRSWPCSAVCCR